MMRSICLAIGLFGLNLAAYANPSPEQLAASGKINQALQRWQQKLNTAADFTLLYQMINHYPLLGQHDAALALLPQLKTHTKTPEQQVQYQQVALDLWLAQQDILKAKAALIALKSALNKVNSPYLASLALNSEAHLQRYQGHNKKALQTYQRALKIAPANRVLQVDIRLNAADAAYYAQDSDTAAILLEQVWLDMQKLSWDGKRLHLQTRFSQQALRLAQNNQHKSRFLTLAGQALIGADKHLPIANTDSPHQRRLRTYIALYFSRLQQQGGNLKQAYQTSQYARFQAQGDAELTYLTRWQQGRIHHAEHRYAAAAEAYRQALDSLQPIRNDLLRGQRNARHVFAEQIKPLYDVLADVLLRQASLTDDPEQQQNYRRAALDTLEQLKSAELENYFQDACVTQQRNRVIRLDKPMPDTAIIYPVILPDRLEILVLLHDGLYQYTQNVTADVIQKQIRRLQYDLQTPRRWAFVRDAKSLYKLLISPLHSLLEQHQIQTLVTIPDASLRLIPLAALVSEKNRYLIEDFALATTPSLEVTDIKPRQRGNVQILLNGLVEGVQGFSALPSVREEIRQIQLLYPDNSTVFLDKNFVFSNISQTLKNASYPIVHIASHGHFDAIPEQSFILTYDNKINLSQLDSLLKQDTAIELLTLSACQTAVGDERAALGLAGIAIKAGAKSTLASLWFVNDEATSHLMTAFYRALTQSDSTKAQALQQAQREILEQRLFRHPAYWSAFLLIGNWL